MRLGVRSLAVHRLRSALTALGIILGVASVIVMLAVGEAARAEALRQLEDLGANTILLRSVKPQDPPDGKAGVDLTAYGLTDADLGRIRATVPTVLSAMPARESRAWSGTGTASSTPGCSASPRTSSRSTTSWSPAAGRLPRRTRGGSRT